MNPDQNIPPIHNEFIRSSVEKLKSDMRILGVAGGGSLILKSLDEYSDLDLIVVVEPGEYKNVLEERKIIAQKLGRLLDSFTGEHVGEPRLLVCLYGPPLLHVDFKFVSLNDINERVDDPLIIWERNSILSDGFKKKIAVFPSPDLEWIENRFWIWIHYTLCKIGRGEIFETIEALGYLRSQVLGPMVLLKAGARPQGVRRLEKHSNSYQNKLELTIPDYNQISCLESLKITIDLYKILRKELIQDEARFTNKIIIQEVEKYLRYIENKIKC